MQELSVLRLQRERTDKRLRSVPKMMSCSIYFYKYKLS